MEETVEFASPDSSLKKYFKYMVTNRNVSIQFSARKIKDIIETDLQINLLAHQSIYARVCTEAFAYYIQTWPEWYSNNDYQYSELGYERLKEYLKLKLMNLKKIERVLSKKNTTVRSVEKPSDLENVDASRYELHICLPNDIFGPNNELSMKHSAADNILLQLNPSSGNLDFTLHHVIHYPFISVEFRLPGLIQIKRSCPYKYEQFLFKYDGCNVPILDNTHIRSIDYDVKQKGQPKVFTYNLMSVFFTQLKIFLAECPQVSDLKRLEIQSLCDAFLDDICETNLALATICERAVVNYNIGRKQYYVDRDLNDDKVNGRIVHRIVWTPIVSYCLDFFSISQESVGFDGVDYFKFTKNSDKSFETILMQYINSSLIYKCLLCDLNFNIDVLKNHLITVHPISKAMKCISCQQIFLTKSLLCSYWKHKCVKDI